MTTPILLKPGDHRVLPDIIVPGYDITVEACPVVPPPVDPPPVDPPPGAKVVTVDANWSQILSAFKDLTVDEIKVRSGTVGAVSLNKTNALRPANKPVRISPVTPLGWICAFNKEGININDGAGYFGLRGLAFRNSVATQGGCIVLGSSGDGDKGVDCFNIDLDEMDIDQTVRGANAPGSTANADSWGLYFGDAYGTGHHNINARNWKVRGGHKGLSGAIQFYHSNPALQNYNAHDVLMSGWDIAGVEQSIMLWDDTVRNIIFRAMKIADSGVYAVRHQYGAYTLDDVVSSGSGTKGLQSANPGRLNMINGTSLN